MALLRVTVMAMAAVVYFSSVGIRRHVGPLALSVLAVAVVYSLWIPLAKPYMHLSDRAATRFGAGSLVADVALITLWCHATGGASSEFWALYPIAVISVALKYDLVEVVATAVGIAVLYVAVMMVDGGLPITGILLRPSVIVLTGLAVGLLARQRRTGVEEREALKRMADRSSAALQRQQLVVERLQQMDDAKTEFVAIASHEFRTPLAAIMGVLNTLRSHGDDIDPAIREELLDGAAIQASRLARLVDDLLTVSRIENGGFFLNIQEVDVADLVRDALKASRTEEVTTVELNGVPRVSCDADHIVRVLANLLENAKKQSPQGSAIELAVHDDVAGARFVVRDHGAGVPPHERRRIFERFRQLGRGSGKSGAGLGLYIARTLIEAHGGTIGVDAARSGGAEFFFTIPAVVRIEADSQPLPTEASSAVVN